MKKLALMTTVAAFMISAPAFAGHDNNMMHKDRGYGETYKIEVQDDPTMEVQTMTKTRTEVRPAERQDFSMFDGRRVIVQGTAVYLANSQGGWKYPAPTGSYQTSNGFTVVSDDGVWLRTEGPGEIVYVDVDDRNNNGMPDRVRTY